ncbi:alcohol dehydrogenase 2 [Niveomyces insectorum RCEF 264]|uniref:Alcohol dehydrogenase 2 n=1 Tax=Niveomyces insectorum RCEF 264 TaxID=1081102 RepID=A0A162MUC7_9HYPO|nr:alcohol dehydrogenase 2 [Niveomyces insectorum RCEF 264]
MTEVLTHKAAILLETGREPKFAVKQVPRPVPGPNDVLIRLNVASICGSDYGLALGGHLPTRDVLGHEGIGRIAALGAHVPSLDPSVAVGQRVGIAWNRDVCGTCAFCTDPVHPGAETRCRPAKLEDIARLIVEVGQGKVEGKYIIPLNDEAKV